VSQSLNRVIDLYARFLAVGGMALAAAVLLTDQRLINAPVSSLALIAAVTFLRAYPVRLSKYSYLTQVAVPVLVGALAVGPSSVVLALLVGVIAADTIWLRKSQRVAVINAGREIIAFTCAFGVYAAVLQASGNPGLSLDFLPAGFSLVAMYFLASRALFYFTMLVRAKLEQVEQLLILRWEVVSMLLSLGACVVVIAALQSLSPAGWVAVAGVLSAIGLLTKRILEEAIAAEDLNKIHLMESAISGNAGLHGSFEQIERLAYRLLDWGDYRICRWDGAEVTLAYRGRIGRPNRERLLPELATFRREVVATGRPVMIRDAGRDPRISAADPDVQSILIYPVRFGDDLLGTFEIDHFKRNAYGPKDLSAVSTIAAQVATAVHIAELRRPLVSTVEQISQQVAALARATESLRTSAAALTQASGAIQRTVAEQDAFVRGGLDLTAALARDSQAMTDQGAAAAKTSRDAAEVAMQKRIVIGDAISRLVNLKEFVADSSHQVAALGEVTRRITGFIGTIREIADATNLIALNAAIEAARAGREGRGFAIVAEEVRNLAAQSLHAARQAGNLVSEIGAQVESVTSQMRRGEEIVGGVEDLSTDAATALDAISRATSEAGEHASLIAETATQQRRQVDTLSGQIERVAMVARRARDESNALSEQATNAARGQADLEGAIRELGEVATELQRIARHFAVDQ
jgi:methyl-accepting chemotaxis protein